MAFRSTRARPRHHFVPRQIPKDIQGAVEAGRRSGAAARLDYDGVQVTAGDGGTRTSSVEGVLTTDKDKQESLCGFKPQEGFKEVNQEASGGVVGENTIEVAERARRR